MPKEAIIRKNAIQILETNGWVCWAPSKVKFKQNDIFGIIDLLAVKKRELKKIQLTTLPNISAKRKKITAFLKKHTVEMTVEVWAWSKKKKGFKKEKISLKTKKKK